jgi:hypothetical protein
MSGLQGKSISSIGAIVGIASIVSNLTAAQSQTLPPATIADNDRTAAPTEMMPRFAFRNERNDSDAISTAAISCVTHGSGEIGITKAKRYQCVYQKPYQ